MNNLYVLSHGRQTAQNISKDMESIFGEFLKVKPICVEDGLFDIDFSKSLVLDTGKWIEDLDMSTVMPKDLNSIRARRVIDFRYLPELMDLPDGTDVLLVNDHQKTTDIAIMQLLELGLDHLNFYPYYPGIKTYRKLMIAVTPGEPHLVPSGVKQIIDIGTRQIDLTTIVEVAEALGVLENIAPTLSSTYIRDMYGLVKKYNDAAKDASEMKDSFQVLADHSSSGIVYVDENRKVVLMNRAFFRLSGKTVDAVIGQNVDAVIPELDTAIKAPFEKHIIKIFDRDCVIQVQNVKRANGQQGLILNIEDADVIQKMEHELRRKNRAAVHDAKYHFNDIHFKSSVMQKTIQMAKRVSISEATILLQGESGTGKELLAQAMHNHSSRKGGPFVPVNFAALPENLIESELFGYEDGAFTGARKGGSQGLFEAAHGGTLFLDEIGDAPLSFQTRLLRVLQEKQIRRVGGRKQIPVDVRIIAATNKNLIEQVEIGAFRKDLYYRICVLPIEVPNLRDRNEDITLLLKMQMELILMKPVDLNQYLSKSAMDYLSGYSWPGNIRQLTNLAEYLVHIIEPGQQIETESLPFIVKENQDLEHTKLVKSLIGSELCWLLETMHTEGSIGRRALEEIAIAEGVDLSESQIRNLLMDAYEKELVVLGKGRAGSKLTSKGQSVHNMINGI